MVMKQLEDKLGLPRLSQVSEALQNLPDEKQLQLLFDILKLADRLSVKAPDLTQVIQLIEEVNKLPTEKLEKTEKLLKRIDGIMKKAPQELLDFVMSLKE